MNKVLAIKLGIELSPTASGGDGLKLSLHFLMLRSKFLNNYKTHSPAPTSVRLGINIFTKDARFSDETA